MCFRPITQAECDQHMTAAIVHVAERWPSLVAPDGISGLIDDPFTDRMVTSTIAWFVDAPTGRARRAALAEIGL